MDADALATSFLDLGPGAVVAGLRPLEELTPAEAARVPPLPYADPAFSERVLFAHLDQTTDQSSRRIDTIRRQVRWLRRLLPSGALARVFHPMCGPGLFAAALRDTGTEAYLGLDIAPAAIRYARGAYGWPAAFVFRQADAFDPAAQPPPGSCGVALLTYESLNAFPEQRARRLLRLARRAVARDGYLVAEVRTARPPHATFVPREVEEHTGDSIFASGPHLVLREWGVLGRGAEIMGHRFIVVQDDGAVSVHHSLVWRYDGARLRRLLAAVGFGEPVLLAPPRLETDKVETLANRFLIAMAASSPSPERVAARKG